MTASACSANRPADAGARKGRAAVLALLLATFAFGMAQAIRLRWTCDDAFISFRYAENLVDGLGLVYNAGERVEGYTNFLWTLMLALGARAGCSPPAAAQALGLLSYAGLAGALAWWSWRRSRRSGGAFIPLAALAALLMEDFQQWSTGGLETMCFAGLGVTAALLARAGPAGGWAPAAAGAAASLLVLTRLDGALTAGMVVLSYWIPWSRAGARASLRASLLAGAPVAVTLAAWMAWKLAYYGDVFPTAFYSKSAARAYFSQGLCYAGLFLLKNWFLAAAPLALLACGRATGAAAGRTRGGETRHAAFFLATGALSAIYVMHTGGDFMFARRLVPLVPFALLAIEEGVLRLPAPRARRAAAAAIVLAAALPWPLYSPARLSIRGIADERRYYPAQAIEIRRQQAEAVAGMLTNRNVRAAFEGGMCVFGYYSRLPYLVEITGLTQYSLAKLPLLARGRVGHEKTAPPEWLADHRIHFVFSQAFPQELDSGPGPRPFDEIRFGDTVRARVCVYSDEIMDGLRDNPQVTFAPIERVLADLAPRMEAGSREEAEGIYRRLEDYYFRAAGPRGRSQAEAVRAIVDRKPPP